MLENIKSTQVLIVGAGPSGLMMACQLARYGIPFRIIDKKTRPVAYSGGLFIHARSLEILHQMGIAHQAIREGILASKIHISFNGKKPLSLSLKNMGKNLTKFPYLLMLEQWKTEQFLEEYLLNHGSRVEKGTEFLNLAQHGNEVTSTLQLPNGNKETVITSYIVAADGGQSPIRNQLNITFLGKTHELSLFVMDSKADAEVSTDEIRFSFTKHASTGMFPLKGGRWRIDGTIPGELKSRQTVAFKDIVEKFTEPTFTNLRLEKPDWFSVFHSHQRYAANFKQNRCFLIGDAAHVFSPVGAQGMNTGMQDAYNLAWKLALVIRKKAPDSLLSTYHAERHQLAKGIVRHTDTAFSVVTSNSFIFKNIRLRIVPVLLRFLLPTIEKNRSFGQFLFKKISEIGISYHHHASIRKVSKGHFPTNAPKPGDRLPFMNFSIDGKQFNIQENLPPTGFHLFLFAPHGLIDYKIAEKYKDVLTVQAIPFEPGTAKLYKRFGIRKEGCYLIRPDMHIAFRSKQHISDVDKFLDSYFL